MRSPPKRTFRGAVFFEGDVVWLDRRPTGLPEHKGKKVKVTRVTRGGRDIHVQHDDQTLPDEIVHASRLSRAPSPV